jgi:hypothetical protein
MLVAVAPNWATTAVLGQYHLSLGRYVLLAHFASNRDDEGKEPEKLHDLHNRTEESKEEGKRDGTSLERSEVGCGIVPSSLTFTNLI